MSVFFRIVCAPLLITGLFISFARADAQSDRIQSLLSMKVSKVVGPNCWNSVLFVKGLSPGIYYSEDEIDFWFNSPFCEKVQEPKPGDIIDILYRRPGGAAFVAVPAHSYIYLSKINGFTKNGPEQNADYKISSHNEVTNFYNVADKCVFRDVPDSISDECFFAVARVFRCQSIEQMPWAKSSSEVDEKLRILANKMTARVFTGTLFTEEDSKTLVEIRKMAIAKMKAPLFSDLPADVQQSLRWFRDMPERDSDGGDTEENRNHQTVLAFMNAHPSQNLPPQIPQNAEISRIFRARIPLTVEASILNNQEFYYWSYVYFATNGILNQYKIMKQRPR